ncbi:16S rRNA (guanine(966)-N(2))-methyltransferase RsmD [Brevibacillus humidisoli]|uniref:16S rRNA (guanine(966)-N(2))-methyltransferase RsmD n=1 Tax=Brevibacillus humidisoli TaxID=2895522 RepID=UPI001E51F756|nr:16S rRNA (guanine(966)-N(2))-methyltransferase RsmD [Brevibacillus humidisoli]UFJ42063.1 16S rRNA (guanine(966)-N(2))-methyltransferase RsmD [Brevibacillus humidisoli]
MRVIAGEYRGRSLTAVPGKGTRPTTDKVKESIFNMIGPYFDGGWVLDLYAGTGGLAIESLSRGMEGAICIDIDPKAVAVIKNNLASLGLAERAEVYRNDAERSVRALAKRAIRFDLVFLDPPYAQQKIASDLTLIQQFGLLASDAWIVAEHDTEVSLPEQIVDCVVDRRASYGDTCVSVYRFTGKIPAVPLDPR